MNRFVFPVLGIIFFGFNLISSWEHYLLQQTAVSKQAVVSTTWVTRRRGGPAFNTGYRYEVLGRSYEGEGLISLKTYAALRPGDPIEIRYVPSSPTISETAEMSHNGTSIFVTAGLGIPVSLAMIILPFLKKPEKQKVIQADPSPKASEFNLPPLVQGIAFTVYPVMNMKRARAFYEGALGLKMARNLHGEWVEYHLWDTCFALTTLMGDGVKPGDDGGKIALEVSDVDGFIRDLRHLGTRIKMEPFSTPICRMAVIYDPEGNALTLHKRLF